MRGGRHAILMILSCVWLLLVFGYMLWGAFTYAGLYRWAAELQVEQWGGYYKKWTAILPGLILALPALFYLGWRGRIRQVAEAHSPVAQARTAGRTARYTLLIGLVLMLIGGGAFAWSQTLPDGSEPPETIDAARLAAGAPPQTKVRLRGNDDAAARVQYLQRGADERIIFYAGFRLEGEGKDGPLRLFIARNTPGPEALTTLQAFLPEQTGYLVENGLPEDALNELRGRGLQVASPHYVLQTGDLARREPYYIAAALGGFTGFVCLIVGLAGLVQARRRAWLATAIRADGTPVEGAPPLR